MPVDVSPKEARPKVYLGDGVYAEFDGYHINIFVSDGVTYSQPIYIDRAVWSNLVSFAVALGFKP